MSAERSALLARLLADEGIDLDRPLPIAPRGDGGPAPLSFAQEVLWLVDRASADTGAYNVRLAYRVTGDLDVDALGRALDALVARHEALRTTFAPGAGSGTQQVHPAEPATVLRGDFRAWPDGAREDAASAFLRQAGDMPFDLTSERPFRVALARIAEREHLLLLVTHHIVVDGWSCGILIEDLSTLYDAARGAGPAPAPPALQFADFATWQRTAMPERDLDGRLAYWRERLRGVTPLELPVDRPTANASAGAGETCERVLTADASARVRGLAERCRATPYMVLLAAWQTVLHRLSGQHDIVVGSPVAGRTRTETERIVGYFAQALPMRTSFAHDPSFAEVLARAAEAAAGAFDHQDVPLEALALEAVRAGGRAAPLFRAVLTVRDPVQHALRLGDARADALTIDGDDTKFDLTLLAGRRDDRMAFTLWYRTALFARATAERLLRQLERVLEAGAADPARRVSGIDLLASDERAAIERWNDTARDLAADRPLHARVAEHAARTPGAIAVRCGDAAVDYRELDARAARIAGALHALGVRRGARVAIGLEPSIDAIAAMLGIWKTGAAFVPLALDAPGARLRGHVQAGGAAAIVAGSGFGATLDAGVSIVDPIVAHAAAFDDSQADCVALDDPAYVIFTSGSTGAPKAVCVTHRNVANYAAAILERLGATDEAWSFATVSTLAADLGNTAIFAALASGGTLRVIPGDAARDPVRFAAAMTTPPVDVLKITPSHLRALLDGAPAGANVLPRRRLVCGGEALHWTLADQLRDAGCALFNHYGPTEATVGACTFEVTREAAAAARAAGAQTVPIGTPLANVRLHVLDAARSPVGFDGTGELYVAGAGVADGYLGRADLTAERFVELAGGERAYRTGDRVRRLPSGDLEYLGRIDRQVKLRGFRVELGEIEATLNAHADVAAAAVALGDGDDQRLVAYVVSASGGDALADALREHAARSLPEHMLPASYIVLAAMPLTPNGKLDYAALPKAPSARRSFVAARTPTERTLATMWQDVFKREGIGATDDFFELGGHSLLAIRVLGQIRRIFGVRLPVRTLLDAPALEQLAAVVDTEIELAALEALSEDEAHRRLGGEPSEAPR